MCSLADLVIVYLSSFNGEYTDKSECYVVLGLVTKHES